ncbi:MAG TPA: MmgE/PrpD family protein [Bryobacteraceae bacterium]|nr:MmgE/PrpD family protein [Bryobacteraceae bacterium]
MARYVVQARAEVLPANVRKEATCTFVNFVGCALVAAVTSGRHSHCRLGLLATGPNRLFGRKEMMDVFHEALLNGISSHVLDFDDTYLKTVIHPGGPVIPALLVLAERQPVSDATFFTLPCWALKWSAVLGRPSTPKGTYYWSGSQGTIFCINPVEDLVGVLMVQLTPSALQLRERFSAIVYSAPIE